MKPKTLILVVVAVACGLGASYMTARLLAERQPHEEEKIEILVAKKNLSVGERIVKPEEMFEKKLVTKENEPPDAIRDFETLKGKAMRTSRIKGDHVTAGNLLDKNRLEIPDGHYAVGLPVNLQTTAHGLATLPGSRVDVLLTVKGDVNNTFTKVVVENVLVLAADARVSPDGELIAAASVVTLALTNKEALIATTTKDMGVLTLRLRNLNDMTKAEEDRMDGRQILEKKGPREPEKITAPPAAVEVKPEAPKGTLHTQVIINGTNVQSMTYRKLENGDILWPGDEGYGPVAQTPRPRVQPQPQPQPAPGNTKSREL